MPGGQGHGPAVDAQQRLVPAEELEAVAVQAAWRRPHAPGRCGRRTPGSAAGPARLPGRGELEPFHPQVRLGGGDGGLHQGQGMRGDGGLRAGDVHDAQQRAGIRIVERHGRAAPRVDGALVVLGAGNLDAAAQGQGGARGAGADGGLGPVGARNEHHALGPALHGGVAFHPEQPAHLVAHGHQHPAVVAGQDQQLVDHGHDGGQRMLPPVLLEFFAVHRQRGLGIVRVGVQLGRTLPGFLDQAAEAGQLPALRERQPAGVQLLVAGTGHAAGASSAVTLAGWDRLPDGLRIPH